jgi:hypothetical protein
MYKTSHADLSARPLATLRHNEKGGVIEDGSNDPLGKT